MAVVYEWDVKGSAEARFTEWKYDRSGDPGGIRTRDLDLERVASWARLDDGVSHDSIPAPAEPGRASNTLTPDAPTF